MRRVVVLTLAACFIVAALSPLAVSAPEPKVVPADWEIKFTCEAPQPIILRLPGEEQPRVFWYMLYTVTNQTGQDRIYVPNFVLYTDSGQILRGAESVSPSVFQAIQLRHHAPLLDDVSAMTGLLRQGEDNAKDGVAIFTDIDGAARAFDVFVGGLTGELVREKLPTPVKVTEPDNDGKTQTIIKDEIVLRKTLLLHYRMPDDASLRNGKPAIADGSGWVMR